MTHHRHVVEHQFDPLAAGGERVGRLQQHLSCHVDIKSGGINIRHSRNLADLRAIGCKDQAGTFARAFAQGQHRKSAITRQVDFNIQPLRHRHAEPGARHRHNRMTIYRNQPCGHAGVDPERCGRGGVDNAQTNTTTLFQRDNFGIGKGAMLAR